MKTKFWEEQPGVQSSMRLAFLAVIAQAILFSTAMGVVGLVKYYHSLDASLMDIVTPIITMVCSLVGTAGTLKVIQKNNEPVVKETETPNQ